MATPPNNFPIGTLIPYHRSIIGEPEIEEVLATLKSGWLTAGPRVAQFEARFSTWKGGGASIGVQSATAALFLALKALEIGPGDEVITTPYTFVATANVIVHCGATPVFADIDPATLNIDPQRVVEKITPRTKALIPVHIGGNPCQMGALKSLAQEHGLFLIEDCAHSIEGEWEGIPLGAIGDIGAFSFYPTKNITAAEGGMVFTRNENLASKLRLLSRHGLSKSVYERDGRPEYDIVLPGYKCNMTDLQAAIGLRQMDRLMEMYQRRLEIYDQFEAAFRGQPHFQTISPNPEGRSALHLYILRMTLSLWSISRDELVAKALERGIQLSINYHPIHLFTWYRKQFGYKPGDFPQAEMCGNQAISLPFYPDLSDDEVQRIIGTLLELTQEFGI